MKLFLDAETTTFNKGHPFDPRNELVSYAYDDISTPAFRYYTDPDFDNPLQGITEVIGFNIKFDLLWLAYKHAILDLEQIRIWDVQLADFVYQGQTTPLRSLNDVLIDFDIPTKLDLVKEFWDTGVDTKDIPVPILKEYNQDDVYKTRLLYNLQQALLTDTQKALVYAMGEDMKSLMDMEWNGIKVDFEKAETNLKGLKQEVVSIEEALRKFLPEIKHGKFNYDSGDHLSALLYGAKISFDYSISEETTYKTGPRKGETYIKNRWQEELVDFKQRFEPIKGTEVKKTQGNGPGENHFYQTDEPTLKKLRPRIKEDKELLSLLAQRAEKIKMVEMVETIKKQFEIKQWENNIMHGQYNQNVAATGRLSSSGPNQQNFSAEIDELLVSRYV